MNEEKAAEPTPAKYRFTWRGADFKWIWQGGASHWTWEATLRFAGGVMTGVGATPQEALTAAAQTWVNEVNRLLGYEA